MRNRIMSLGALSGLIMVVALGAPAGASRGASAVSHNRPAKAPAFAPNLTILYNQTANDSGVGIVSQDFTDSGFDVYDSVGADDFTVPSGHVWTVQGVRFIGVYFSGPGPASSEKLTIYADGGGKPGAALGQGTVHATDAGGTFTAKLPNVKLNPGTYWVSLQPVLEFATGGEWGWETTNDLHGSAAVWQNPGNGFGTGCTTWANMQGCIGALGEGPDFMFAVAGSST